jgi:trimeric autotransporter adhesin
MGNAQDVARSTLIHIQWYAAMIATPLTLGVPPPRHALQGSGAHRAATSAPLPSLTLRMHATPEASATRLAAFVNASSASVVRRAKSIAPGRQAPQGSCILAQAMACAPLMARARAPPATTAMHASMSAQAVQPTSATATETALLLDSAAASVASMVLCVTAYVLGASATLAHSKAFAMASGNAAAMQTAQPATSAATLAPSAGLGTLGARVSMSVTRQPPQASNSNASATQGTPVLTAPSPAQASPPTQFATTVARVAMATAAMASVFATPTTTVHLAPLHAPRRSA